MSSPVQKAQRARVPRRTPRACQQCRTAKVRCSALFPCTRCVRRRDTCVFVDDPKVSVSERYLLDLERRAALAESSAPEPTAAASVAHRASRPPVTPATDRTERSGSTAASAGRGPRWRARSAAAGYDQSLSTPSSLGGEDPVVNDSAFCSAGDRAVSPMDPAPGWTAGAAGRTAAALATASAGSAERSSCSSGSDGKHSHANDQPSAVFQSNPLVKDSCYYQDAIGRFRFMGPTSTWAFFVRATAMLQQRFPQAPPTPADRFNSDGSASSTFRLTWVSVAPDSLPDVTSLPSSDYSLYVFHSLRFYLGSYFQLLDEPLFLARLKQFEADPLGVAQRHRLWFVEYLLVLAFGEACMETAGTGGGPPAGCAFAARAMALLPDRGTLHDEGLLGIEVLGLVALYFHSIDMRVHAFQYALRLCYVSGIHREMPEDVVGHDVARRCRDLWWAVYVMDRRMSALMGAPSSIRDEDITTPLPAQKSSTSDALSLTLFIRLSRLLASIVMSVYAVDDKLGCSFVKNIRTAIKSLAEVAQEGGDALLMRHQITHPSRITSSIPLMYHYCILQATRPLVMCLLKGFLGLDRTRWNGPPGNNSTAGTQNLPRNSNSNNTIWISAPIVALLKTSIASALTTLRILRSLEKQRLMDAFLPFDLDHAVSSATLLSIVQTILPACVPDATWCDTVHGLLGVMTAHGSVMAAQRQADLRQLEQMLALARASTSPLVVETDGAILLPVMAAATTTTTTAMGMTGTAEGEESAADDQTDLPSFLDPSFDVDILNPDPGHLFDLAFQLGVDSETDIIGNL